MASSAGHLTENEKRDAGTYATSHLREAVKENPRYLEKSWAKLGNDSKKVLERDYINHLFDNDCTAIAEKLESKPESAYPYLQKSHTAQRKLQARNKKGANTLKNEGTPSESSSV
ncbi:MAG: hypothetical protein M1836_003720 [Candelina mexicana]|nr:MAG: hypothetical protein M1836_003720 [Candelina mexicana]